MDIIAKAKKILAYYKKRGAELNSALNKTDHQQTEETKNILLFFKHKTTTHKLTERLAKQIVNRDVIIKNYHYLNNFIKINEDSYSKAKSNRTAKLKTLSDAKLLTTTCNLIHTVYEKNQDTAEFDENVNKIAQFLSKNVVTIPGIYLGVSNNREVLSVPKLDDKLTNIFVTFNDKMLHTITNEKQH